MHIAISLGMGYPMPLLYVVYFNLPLDATEKLPPSHPSSLTLQPRSIRLAAFMSRYSLAGSCALPLRVDDISSASGSLQKLGTTNRWTNFPPNRNFLNQQLFFLKEKTSKERRLNWMLKQSTSDPWDSTLRSALFKSSAACEWLTHLLSCWSRRLDFSCFYKSALPMKHIKKYINRYICSHEHLILYTSPFPHNGNRKGYHH